MNFEALKAFLDEKVEKFYHPEFIETDPIQVPHRFSKKEDIEIAGFLTATISWGNRPAIIKNATRMMKLLDNEPFEFIINSSKSETDQLQSFVHRTFNGNDLVYFVRSLQNIYRNYGGLQQVFESGYKSACSVYGALQYFHQTFFEPDGERTQKHVSNVGKGASAKRLNMFLRWMCRNDKVGVDFGLWKGIPASKLMLPLDLHTGNVGRKLGLLQRRSNDWKAVEEITANLCAFDPFDPIKYDFALFGLGVFEKF